MTKKSTSHSAFFNLRVLLGFTLSFLAVALAIFAGLGGALRGPDGPSRTAVPAGRPDQPARYMPVPGANVQDETTGLTRLEQYWNDRLTFPTGRFNPAWVRAAAAQHSRMQSGVPSGQHLKLNMANPNALSTTSFTPLGPQPERMTGCSGCFDYTLTQGRVNTSALDPTTTINGSIVAYIGTVGGGVWKTTNCCSGSTIARTRTWNSPRRSWGRKCRTIRSSSNEHGAGAGLVAPCVGRTNAASLVAKPQTLFACDDRPLSERSNRLCRCHCSLLVAVV